jgi:hypothetical protein
MRLPQGKLLALIALVVAASMVMATGAFSSVTADRSTDVEVVGDKNAFLALEQGSGPNGQKYATTNDGRLAVNLDGDAKVNGQGVNPSAVTSFDNVFTITNKGSQSVDIRIQDSSDAVTFYKNGDPTSSIESAGSSLGVGSSVKVGINVDTTSGVAQGNLLEAITVHATAPNSGQAPGADGKPQDPA